MIPTPPLPLPLPLRLPLRLPLPKADVKWEGGKLQAMAPELFFSLHYDENHTDCILKRVEMTAALGSGSTTRPPLPQQRPRAPRLILGSAGSRFEATRQPSSGPPKAADLRPNPLTGILRSCVVHLIADHPEPSMQLGLELGFGSGLGLAIADPAPINPNPTPNTRTLPLTP